MTTEPDAIGADAIGADANMSDGGTVAIAPFVVGAEWLIANLDGIQVLDPRDAEAFDAAHVPGALPFAPSSVRGSVDGVGSQLLPAADVEAALSAAGLRDDLPVAVVGTQVNTNSARLAWVLANQGHETVYYLDGGFRAWLEAGGPTDTTAPNFDAAPYGSGEQLGSYRVDAEWVRDHLDDESVALLDVRTSGEFADGFIPGAINIDWTTNVSNGAFLDETALRTLFAPLGGAGDTVVVYCRSGSRASVSWAALHWLGFDALLYDGSWSEWGSLDPAEYPRSLPVGQ